MRASKHRVFAGKTSRRKTPHHLSRRMFMEQLEDRRVMACDYSVLADDLQEQLQSLQLLVKDKIELIQSLPIIGDGLADAGSFLSDLTSQLHGALGNLEDNVLEPVIKIAILEALGDSGLDILGNHDGNPNVIDEGDIDVEITNTANQCSVEVGMHLTRDLVSFDLGLGAKFDLGLPALPFSIATTGGLTAAVGFDWPDFRFILDSDDGVTFDLSPTTDLSVNVTAGLQEGTELTADIGFLHATVTDGVTIEENGSTQTLNSQFSAGIDIGLGLAQNGTFEVDIVTDTEADIALHINAMIDQDFPSVSGDFLMHWDGFEPGSDEPTVELKNITVDVGGYISEVLSPIVNAIKDVAEPLMPAVDFVTSPIPVLSDLSNAIGLGDVTLLSLSEVADDYLPKSGYTEIVEIVQIVVQVVNIANMFEDPAGPSLLINVGDLLISNGDNGDLRDQPAAKSISDFENKMTELSADPQNFVNLKNAIEGSDLPAAIKGPLTTLINRFTSGIYYEFPILDNPLTEIGKLLLGQDSTLFSFSANFNVAAEAELSYPIFAGVDAVIQGEYELDAGITIGYDTFGLRKFIAHGIESNGGFDGLDLLDGIFIDAGSKVHMDGGFAAGVSAEYLVFEAQVTGGVSGGFHLDMPAEDQLVVDDNFNDGDTQKIRPFSELGECLFAADGVLMAGLKVKLRIGLGDLAVEEEFTIAETEIASFDVGCVPNPFQPPPDPNLAELNPDTGELTLHVGDLGSLRANYEPGQIDEQFKVTVGIPFASELDPPMTGDLIVVSAYGMTERFPGVTKIIANAGDGNDKIKILKSGNPDLYPLTAVVDLRGGSGNDQLIYEGTGSAKMEGETGDDRLYGGNGPNTLFGGEGFDILEGGASENLLNGGNDDDTITGGSGPNQMGAVFFEGVLLKEDGNDQLIGGAGPNFIRGGAGDDVLSAGPMTDDLDGDEGDDHLSAGAGSAKLSGNRGDDYIAWEVGDGIPWLIDGGSDIESNTLGLVGTDAVESLGLFKDPASARLRISGLTNPWFFASFIQNVAFEGLGEADQIVVAPLTDTSVRSVGLNLGDVLKDKNGLGDGAVDSILVLGNQTADSLLVEKELAIIKPSDPNSQSRTGRGDPIYGGITKITGMPTYTVRLANIMDDLVVATRDGDDTVTVKSITGPTQILTARGNDTINVLASDPGVPGSETKLPDYPLELEVDAGQDVNKLIVDQTASLIPLNVAVTTELITSDLLPGVSFTATNGNYLGGIQLKTGTFADSVNIRSTLPQVPVMLDTSFGDDIIRVGSEAPDLTGHLGFIRGPLSIDASQGQNFLALTDRDSLSGNPSVFVTSDQIAGFAGPANNIIVQYKATQGQFGLGLLGSDVAMDKFRLVSPQAFTQILGNGGDDQVQVFSLTQPAAIGGGNGNDVVEVGAVANTLDNVLAMLLYFGQDGNDTLNINDKSANAGHDFTLNSNTVLRSGAGLIQFDESLETINVSAGSFADNFQVQSLPTPTDVNLVGSAGIDKLIGPDSASIFEISGNGAGTLNELVSFMQCESLQGGAAGDAFRMLAGGQLSGQIHGGGGSDQIDYSTAGIPVSVNLELQSATNIGSFASIERLRGSSTTSTLIGPNLPNLWNVSGTDSGVVNTLALGPIVFESFGHLTGGTSVDAFFFAAAGFLSGRIQELGGTSDQLNYASLSDPVLVNLQSGIASRVALGAAGIEQVIGGSNDDLIIGNNVNNQLTGGGGHDVLVGLAGDDILNGGDGNDVLIGGLGADELSGGSGEDLLIGNRTTYDTNVSALMALVNVWKNSAVPYAQRVNTLRNGFGSNGQYKLDPSTVLQDQAVDSLFGGDDTDWFWATPIGPFQDTINDEVPGELVN